MSFENSYVKLTRFLKGLSYSTLEFESNSDTLISRLEVTIVDGDKIINGMPCYSGGADQWSGGFGFGPMESKILKICIKDKYSDKEKSFVIDTK